MRAHHFSKGLMASQGASLRVVSTLKPQTDDQVGPHYSTERNGICRRIILRNGICRRIILRNGMEHC